MKDIAAIVVNTPIPTLLIIAGLVFLLLSIAEKVTGHIKIAEQRKGHAMIFGLLLLVIGMGFEIMGPRLAAEQSAQTKVEENPLVAVMEDTSWERPLMFAPLAKPDFDCSSYFERPKEDSLPQWDVICASEKVAEADRRAADFYRAYLKSQPAVMQPDIKQEQRDWLKLRDASCALTWDDLRNTAVVQATSDCLVNAYEARIIQFQEKMAE